MKNPHRCFLTVITIATIPAAGDQTDGLGFQEPLAEHFNTSRGYGTGL